MPYIITAIETTPNPNARKLLVEPSPGAIRSFFKPEDAQDDELGRALFAIPGITNVLIHTEFLSVCAEPGSNWTALSTALKKTLAEVQST
jgi:Scaffold protein Nfu/NifU N terminal